MHFLTVDLAIEGTQRDKPPEAEFLRESATVRGSFQFDVRKDGVIRVCFIREEGETGFPKSHLLVGASVLEQFMKMLGCPLSAQQLRAVEQKQPIQGFVANISTNDFEQFFG